MHKFKVKYIEYDENMSKRDLRCLEHESAYCLLREMLREEWGITAPVILKTENGKPYVENDGVYFSVTHTPGLVACAIADCEVGIDCEYVKERSSEEMKKFASRFFTRNEIDFLAQEGYSPLSFYKVWTGKEATLKKLGTTMKDIKNIDVTRENIVYYTENGYIISINI